LQNYAQGRQVQVEYGVAGASKQGLRQRTSPDGSIELTGTGTGQMGYIDIADLTLGQAYEIKPIEAEQRGMAELNWYLSFLPGWTPGTIYPTVPTYIGTWPTDPTRDVYAQMRIPGVIVYWERLRPKEPVPIPIPIPEQERERSYDTIRTWNPQPFLRTCGVVIVVGVTIIILIDPVPGDEIVIPLIWTPVVP